MNLYSMNGQVNDFKSRESISEKGNPSVRKANGSWKISDETKVLQLVEKIIMPLEKIIYLYIPTNSYVYIPGTKDDCWNYMEQKIENVYCHLNAMVFLNDSQYNRVKEIIDTVHTFMKGFSGVDSIQKSGWFEINPNLLFFHSSYSMPFKPNMNDWKEEDFEIAKHLPLFSYIPNNEKEVAKRRHYIEYLHCYSSVRNFKWDKYDTSGYSHESPEDIMLMHELAYTLRLVFIDAFPELGMNEE